MNEIPACPEEQQQQPTELTGRQALLHEIGSKLSQSRSTSGESIEQAVRKLKLRKSHLQALENGDWDNMPDDVYVLGFLRQYSQYLGIDLSDELHRLKNNQYALTKPLTFPDPPVAPSRRWAWIAGTAFVVLFILFNITTEKQHMDKQDIDAASAPATAVEPAADTASGMQASDKIVAAGGAAQRVILPSADQAAAETQPEPSPADNSPINKAPAIKTAVTATSGDEERAPAIPAATDSALAAPHHKAQTAPAQRPGVNTTMHRFRFDAVGSPVWLQISRPDQSGSGKGSLVKEVLLQPGFHTTIHAQSESLWITCGNAPALRISVDGSVFAAAGSLGTGKKVLRDYRFSIGRDN
jgi:cytoskeletal protein RodZ